MFQSLRSQYDNSIKYEELSGLVEQELLASRFIGMGRAAESGAMLLYLFRQVNNIPIERFLHSHEVFERYGSSTQLRIRESQVKHYVFVDDLCGSGTQACQYYRDIVLPLKQLNPDALTYYFVLFSTVDGMQTVRQDTCFDIVDSVFELDESFKAFDDNSRYFAACPDEITKQSALEVFSHYGNKLWPYHPLGFEDGQLLLGFWHNTPDNTLPPIWYNEDIGIWTPIFERYHKLGDE